MRNSSGSKFSLGSAFGRKQDRQASSSGVPGEFGSPSQAQTRDGENVPDSPVSQGGSRFTSGFGTGIGSSGGKGGGGGGGGDGGGEGGTGPAFDGLGKKLGKTFAHQSLLPGLGNKDMRALQDVISTEKGVLTAVEKLANESQKSASVLPAYGLQEGPDLQDILTQSSHLLSHLTNALNVFVEREITIRTSYKKIRDREESLSELRSQRRSTGKKAEDAERKLAKMGPENKGLPAQTELLERLRGEMRQMDTDILKEESAIGDFKRLTIKEILSYKFGGLEELGEKLCIIGEMGKVVTEEIPMEETPPGYGRAPYGGFGKTESAIEEANRCLSSVKFTMPTIVLKPSHLPHAQHLPQNLGAPHLRTQESIAAAEDYANYPGGHNINASPPTPMKASNGYQTSVPRPMGGDYGLDENPYGGITDHPGQTQYDEYGGIRPGGQGGRGGETLWQGPTEEALKERNRQSMGQGGQGGQGGDGIEYAQARIASMYGHPTPTLNRDHNGVSVPSHPGYPVTPRTGTATPPAGNYQKPNNATGDESAEHDYEYAQAQEMAQDREAGNPEREVWKDQPSNGLSPSKHTANAPQIPTPQSTPGLNSNSMVPPWQPLNVKSRTPEPPHSGSTITNDGVPLAVPPPAPIAGLPEPTSTNSARQQSQGQGGQSGKSGLFSPTLTMRRSDQHVPTLPSVSGTGGIGANAGVSAAPAQGISTVKDEDEPEYGAVIYDDTPNQSQLHLPPSHPTTQQAGTITALEPLPPPPPPRTSGEYPRTGTPGTEGYHTPAESPIPPHTSTTGPGEFPLLPPIPASTTARAPSPGLGAPRLNMDLPPTSPGGYTPGGTGGKMSAGAFRKAVPRSSMGDNNNVASGSGGGSGMDSSNSSGVGNGISPRKLPQLPPGAESSALPSVTPQGYPNEKSMAVPLDDPPSYGSPNHADESLR